ncbi:minor teichoic acids biosynthesis protein ggab (Ggab) [Candidatus Apopatosoma intestinale]|nr:minor teichoic acids biosynthesis protein ggab (Ggab) [Candidatus Apopatosoma intestinale]
MNSLVSIIIPVYNGSNYMREAIDSALAQTYKNIEVIVVNDGSDDGGATRDIALSYGRQIRYFEKENGGSSSALNTGIKLMRGDFFSWLSHDDLYLPQKIELEINAVSSERDPCMVTCDGWLIASDGSTIFRVNKKKQHRYGLIDAETFFCNLTHGRCVNGCAVLMPKSVIDMVGLFDENLVYLNDIDYWFRTALNNTKIKYINDRLVKTRIHKDQVSVKRKSLYNSEKHILARKTLDSIDSVQIDGQAALRNLAYFCAMDGLKNELKTVIQKMRLKKCLKKSDFPFFAGILIIGYVRNALKLLRDKFVFKR